MNRIPFSIYDFFGYLASGFLLIVATAYAFGMLTLLKQDVGVVLGTFWTVVAYVLGQILAGPSYWLLERNLVGKGLGAPSSNLFREPPRAWWAKVFPGFFTPLPAITRERVLTRARAWGIENPGDALFFHAFARVKGDEATMGRLSTFLNLYGFCRNISCTLFLAAIVIGFFAWKEKNSQKALWSLGALVASVGMLYRYLKFFRQYSLEVFITYAELPQQGPADAG